jgi:replicative DNA helicase
MAANFILIITGKEDKTMTAGILSGNEKLEASSTKFHNGELIFISSIAEKEKTSLTLSFVSDIAASQNRNIAYFSLEASSEVLNER